MTFQMSKNKSKKHPRAKQTEAKRLAKIKAQNRKRTPKSFRGGFRN